MSVHESTVKNVLLFCCSSEILFQLFFFHPVYNFVDEKLSAITFKFRGRMMYDARLYDVLR